VELGKDIRKEDNHIVVAEDNHHLQLGLGLLLGIEEGNCYRDWVGSCSS
jgi:hypothetical protein